VPGVGATFLDLRPELEDRLRAYLRRLLQVEAAPGPSEPLPRPGPSGTDPPEKAS
jgi:hypothetical protein